MLERADGGARLSRGQEDGESAFNFAALQRPDLALRDQQLSEGHANRCRSTFCTGIRTRPGMPKANHSFYLRRCYLENKLWPRSTESSSGEAISTSSASRCRPTIWQPAKTTLRRRVRAYYGFVFSERPGALRARRFRAHRRRGEPALTSRNTSHWTGGPTPEATIWRSGSRSAEEHPGSWWPDWITHRSRHQDAEETEGPRVPGGGKFEADRGCAGELC